MLALDNLMELLYSISDIEFKIVINKDITINKIFKSEYAPCALVLTHDNPERNLKIFDVKDVFHHLRRMLMDLHVNPGMKIVTDCNISNSEQYIKSIFIDYDKEIIHLISFDSNGLPEFIPYSE